MEKETKIIDQLYIELSQFTKMENAKELMYRKTLQTVETAFKTIVRNNDDLNVKGVDEIARRSIDLINTILY